MAQNEASLMRKTKNELVGIILRKDSVEDKLTKNIESLKEENEKLNSNVSTLNDKIKTLKSDIEKIKEEKSKTVDALKEVNNALENKINTIECLKKENSNLMDSNKKLNASNLEKEGKITNLQHNKKCDGETIEHLENENNQLESAGTIKTIIIVITVIVAALGWIF